jgi:calcineurin-like phosphoesterase family protein
VLKGEKHLIRGNHDYKIADKFVNCWASISDIKQVDYIEPTKGIKTEIICCHYPMLSWRHKEQGSIHLHGHVHGGIQELNKGTRRMDVSVECIDYKPISIDDVVKRMANV